jgi:hypothetical protein
MGSTLQVGMCIRLGSRVVACLLQEADWQGVMPSDVMYPANITSTVKAVWAIQT